MTRADYRVKQHDYRHVGCPGDTPGRKRRGDTVAQREFDRFFQRSGIAIEPVTIEQGRIARQAYRDFGKGRHRAGLNFGDCFAYALARILDQPLLYKGRDFSHTGLQSALKE
jgi:uncharacterized protein with PIN domain